MLTTITLLVIGFSVISSAILMFAYAFFLKDMQKTVLGVVACTALLVFLAGLQLEHLRFLITGVDLFALKQYVALLLATPPAFYFLSREILLPDANRSAIQMLHLLPLPLALVLPAQFIAPVALAIGAGYSIWFARIVYGMRRHVSRFRFEMFFFGFFAVIAVLVLILVILIPYIDPSVFYIAYANFTGLALILIVAALIVFPELLSNISDAAKLSYASSTLNDVDIAAKLKHLEKLMSEDKLFQNENLNLALLAEEAGLSSHQLSELINSQFGIGFSRYVREKRVAEAKRLLREDPGSSVLAISLMTGFRSQSNFYAAFREITGEAPGAFRSYRQSG
jgi:AraC-like DNA-binding protein